MVNDKVKSGKTPDFIDHILNMTWIENKWEDEDD